MNRVIRGAAWGEMGLTVQLLLLVGAVLGHSLASKPNIGEKLKLLGCTVVDTCMHAVYIITDDQDIKLGSLEVQPQLRKLLTEKGMFFQNAFVTTPVCCPSRYTLKMYATMLSTSHVNTMQIFYTDWKVCPQPSYIWKFSRKRMQCTLVEKSEWEQDNGSLHDCSWIQNRILWLVYMHAAGYVAWMAVNRQAVEMYMYITGKYLNNYALKNSGVGVEHIPPGWTTWYTLQGNRYVP